MPTRAAPCSKAPRPMMCRTLGLTPNPTVRFERVGKRNELILTDLDKLPESASLLALRVTVAARRQSFSRSSYSHPLLSSGKICHLLLENPVLVVTNYYVGRPMPTGHHSSKYVREGYRRLGRYNCVLRNFLHVGKYSVFPRLPPTEFGVL